MPTQLVVSPHEGHVFYKPADARDYAMRGLEWVRPVVRKANAQAQK